MKPHLELLRAFGDMEEDRLNFVAGLFAHEMDAPVGEFGDGSPPGVLHIKFVETGIRIDESAVDFAFLDRNRYGFVFIEEGPFDGVVVLVIEIDLGVLRV